MNDAFAELKARYRTLCDVLSAAGSAGAAQNIEFAQAMSHARRLLRRADRTREPSAEIRASVERAEVLSRAIR